MSYRIALRAIALAILSPLLEKNVLKTLATDAPVVFSMSRLIVLAFAAGMLRHLLFHGAGSWPDATLSIAIVLALPILGALERITPDQIVALSTTLLGRFGIGAVRAVAELEPSKFDDHRQDG